MVKRSATRKLVVANPAGLHARPCLAVVNTVRKYRSRVELRKDDQVVDAGEILQLMTLGAPRGTELVATAKGPDAVEVLAALADLFSRNFGLPGAVPTES